jgi:hypothetical protein
MNLLEEIFKELDEDGIDLSEFGLNLKDKVIPVEAVKLKLIRLLRPDKVELWLQESRKKTQDS